VTEQTIDRATCSFPGCERPLVAGTLSGCEEHVRAWDAYADVEELQMAHDVLKPWVESARAIGFDVLTEFMEGALYDLEERLKRARAEAERAAAAL
jgi:hypothetical protein